MDVREVKKTVPWALRTVLELIRSGELKVRPLRSHFVKPERAVEAYKGLWEDRAHYWGVVLDWSQ